MRKQIQIGLIGDYSDRIYTHVKLNESLQHAQPFLNFTLNPTWIPTENITNDTFAGQRFSGFWITPGSPYKKDESVYDVIQWSHENDFPILGTCGGFQYMAVEYAKNVLGWKHAGHEESEPHAEKLLISRLTCSLKGQQEKVLITDKQSWLYRVLGVDSLTGHFNCSYGVNPVFQNALNQYPMVFTACSESGEPRALELKEHRFFNGTLFQPPLDSLTGSPNPLIVNFLNQCALTWL